MNTKQQVALLKAQLTFLEGEVKGKVKRTAVKVVEAITKPEQTRYWRDFKTVESGFTIKASNGKTYPAVKGTDKSGNEKTLIGTRNCNVWSKPF